METIITHSANQTQVLGEKFAKKLVKTSFARPGLAKVLALYGELGSGKTTFVQGFAKGLGIKRRIISPTFVIVRTYTISDKQQAIRNFYHIDLYRIQSERDLEGLGIKEILEDPENVVAIEWPEKLGSLLPEKRWDIQFEYVEDNERRVTIQV